MEVFEYVPGALATGWMVVRIALAIKNGSQPSQDSAV